MCVYFPKNIYFSESHTLACMCIPMGFPGGSDSKESAYNVGGVGLIPGSGEDPWVGNIPWRRE